MKNFLLNQHVIKMNNREKYIVTGGKANKTKKRQQNIKKRN